MGSHMYPEMINNEIKNDNYEKIRDLFLEKESLNSIETVQKLLDKSFFGNVENPISRKDLEFIENKNLSIILDGKDKEKLISKIREISKEMNREDYENFWKNYDKKMHQEFAKISLIRLIQRVKELGFRKCVKKMSIKKLKTLVNY